MKSSHYSDITDELLSAYIDEEVTYQERDLIEAAIVADADIAWRLASLRQTVYILRQLPEIAMPRTFILQEAQVMDAIVARRQNAPAHPLRRTLAERSRALLDGWRAFWRIGNPVLRNAAAAGFVTLLLLVGGDQYIQTTVQPRSAPMAGMASMPTTNTSALATQTQTNSRAQDTAAASKPSAQSVAVVKNPAQPAVQAVQIARATEPAPSVRAKAAVVQAQNAAENQLATGQESRPDDAQANAGAVPNTPVESAPVSPSTTAVALAPASNSSLPNNTQPAEQYEPIPAGNGDIAPPRALAPAGAVASQAKVSGAAPAAAAQSNGPEVPAAPETASVRAASVAGTLPVAATTQTQPVEAAPVSTAVLTEPAASVAKATATQAEAVTATATPVATSNPAVASRQVQGNSPASGGRTGLVAGESLLHARLQLLQLAIALLTITMAFLWWRSRATDTGATADRIDRSN